VFATNVAFGQSVADAFELMERLQLTEMIVLTFCGVQRDGMDTREASIFERENLCGRALGLNSLKRKKGCTTCSSISGGLSSKMRVAQPREEAINQ
jgi:hypothetical protein